MTRQTQGQKNPPKPAEPIPFDEALRRLVNTPPKHRKAARRAKPARAKKSKQPDS